MEDNIEDVINETKSLVDLWLKDLCTTDRTPYLCELQDTKEGKEKIYKYVLKVCSQSDLSVGEALYKFEVELDLNRLND